MANNERYVRQKLVVGVGFLNARSGSLGERVRDAWEEISVLNPEDFKSEEIRQDFEYLLSKRELYVIAGETVKLSGEELEDVRRRIQRIHDSVVR